MDGGKGAAAKRNPTIAFSRKLNLSITAGANGAVGAQGALVLPGPEISPPPERYERRHVF